MDLGKEEDRLDSQIDLRIMVFAHVMFMALELGPVRSPAKKRIALTYSDYNLGNTVFRRPFYVPSCHRNLSVKWVGPDRWNPTQLVL
ncbi:phthalate transporter [Penicillium capsulatum]|uniref:Phthalate transporter n=1 Tax=Penicillium capsulatum TaxID=69766 RepID=A0A9W9HPF7_9EURO|nr:phthalate transporter [Penicillium capsulatum]